jgi:hypothetical protein
MSDSSYNSSGVGLPMLVFIIFLILKLTHNIDWSWWWVTSPLWISFGLAVILIVFAYVFLRAGKDELNI